MVMVKDNSKVKDQVVIFNEPCEEKARMEGELFPGEIDNLLKLVDDWIKKQPIRKKNK
jgi:hypothetical protein